MQSRTLGGKQRINTASAAGKPCRRAKKCDGQRKSGRKPPRVKREQGGGGKGNTQQPANKPQYQPDEDMAAINQGAHGAQRPVRRAGFATDLN